MDKKDFKVIKKSLKNLDVVRDILKKRITQYNEIIILGNGGSSSTASHIAEDYTKNLGIKAYTFSDASRLTCYTNDYGWDETYAKFLEEFVKKDTLIILISSSGNSENIINCVKLCEKNNLDYITLTGFDSENIVRKISKKSKFSLYVASDNYGVVEIMHLLYLHSIL